MYLSTALENDNTLIVFFGNDLEHIHHECIIRNTGKEELTLKEKILKIMEIKNILHKTKIVLVVDRFCNCHFNVFTSKVEETVTFDLVGI